MAQDFTYQTKNFERQGGSEWDVGGTLNINNGGSLVVESGGKIDASAGTVKGVGLAAFALTGFKQIKVTGHSGAGACTATGAAVGDRVLAIFGVPAAGGDLTVPVLGTDFEAAISVTNQIQQASATDWHLESFVLILVPAAN